MSRERSTSFYSARSTPSTNGYVPGLGRSTGPLIVDGSGETESPYAMPQMHFPVTTSESASLSDDPTLDTPKTMFTGTPNHEMLDNFALDQELESSMTTSLPNLQFGDFPARGATKLPQTLRSEPHILQPLLPPQLSQHANYLPHVQQLQQAPPLVESAKTQRPSEPSNGLGIDFFTPPPETSGSLSPKNIQKAPQKLAEHGSPSLSGLEKSLKPLSLLSPVREVRTPSPTATRSSVVPYFGMHAQPKASHARSLSLSSNDRPATATQLFASPLATAFQSAGAENGKAKAPASSPDKRATTYRADAADEAPLSPKSNGGASASVADAAANGTAATSNGTSAWAGDSTDWTQQQQTSNWQQQSSKRSKKAKQKNASVSGITASLVDGGERKGG